MISALLCLALLTRQEPSTSINIGYVDFFGQTGVDVARIKGNLGLKDGDEVQIQELAAKKTGIDKAVREVTGKPATDLALVGFDEKGRYYVFIGIPGPTVKPSDYRKIAGTEVQLNAEGLGLYKQFSERLMPAMQAGHAAEDDSQGYSLSVDEELHAIQLKMREYALTHQAEIFGALDSKDETQRVAAAHLLGYAMQSPEQLSLLVRSAADPHETVRNNATRALGVLIKSGSKLAKGIDPGPFIRMVCSGVWSDRNKGAMVLEELAKSREPGLLRRIRAEALPSLVEMARWRSSGHSYSAKFILGRVGGIGEGRLESLVAQGKTDEIISAAGGNRLPHPHR
jgi:hypothetical protein